MAVRAKRKNSGVGRLEYAVSAADILKEDHPLHSAFVKWLGDKSASKRQAAKFLQVFPHYREVRDVSVSTATPESTASGS